MALSEFDLIARYFSHAGTLREDVALGVGDDCALLRPPAGQLLALTTDTMVDGVHFPHATRPGDLGHKALAVNLSDLAAMGAEPAWVTLALTLPAAEPAWLEAFAGGFAALAREHGVALVGGDTTRGPLSVTVQAHGFVPPGQALTRGGARPGDLVYVTGTLGDAGLALLALQGEIRLAGPDLAVVRERLDRPRPRVEAGLALRGIASACIDISDGLAADLGHILEASGAGATLYLERLPVSVTLAARLAAAGGWSLPLSGGDDYELCFTVPAARQGEAERALAAAGCPAAWVGVIEAAPGLRCVTPEGDRVDAGRGGWQHFGG